MALHSALCSKGINNSDGKTAAAASNAPRTDSQSSITLSSIKKIRQPCDAAFHQKLFNHLILLL